MSKEEWGSWTDRSLAWDRQKGITLSFKEGTTPDQMVIAGIGIIVSVYTGASTGTSKRNSGTQTTGQGIIFYADGISLKFFYYFCQHYYNTILILRYAESD